jgi:hypothetical protein
MANGVAAGRNRRVTRRARQAYLEAEEPRGRKPLTSQRRAGTGPAF